MDDFSRLLERYDYEYPPEAVALEPATPRDSARLLVYDPDFGQAEFDTYRRLVRHLPSKCCLVFNQTKVLPARIEVTKKTGGRARLLFLRDLSLDSFVALSDRKLKVGETVRVGSVDLEVASFGAGEYQLRLPDGLAAAELFVRYGRMPLPPYLKKTPLRESEIRRKYQTVFARKSGSVAAPTASLHFTPRLLESLRQAGHEIAFVTLHVNLGTFSSLRPEQVEAGKLHEETYEIGEVAAEAIARAKSEGRPVIAVGTTVVRTLESAAARRTDESLAGSGRTDLFIRPGYSFRVIDGLVTNFHVPKSSLMMLVAALVGRECLLDLYQQAISAGCRIFSFGDGMLIRPKLGAKR